MIADQAVKQSKDLMTQLLTAQFQVNVVLNFPCKRQTTALRGNIFLYKSQERGYHLLENKSLKDHRLLHLRVFQMMGKRGQNV